MNEPFCFRCGGVPQYQVELKTPCETLGVWVLCAACVKTIRWTEILTDVVAYEDEKRKQEKLDD